MLLGIFIGLVIAFFIWVFGGAVAEASKSIMWRGTRYKLIGGILNRYCPHDLGLHQQVNGIEMRGCIHCGCAFVKWSDTIKVDYGR